MLLIRKRKEKKRKHTKKQEKALHKPQNSSQTALIDKMLEIKVYIKELRSEFTISFGLPGKLRNFFTDISCFLRVGFFLFSAIEAKQDKNKN